MKIQKLYHKPYAFVFTSNKNYEKCTRVYSEYKYLLVLNLHKFLGIFLGGRALHLFITYPRRKILICLSVIRCYVSFPAILVPQYSRVVDKEIIRF